MNSKNQSILFFTADTVQSSMIREHIERGLSSPVTVVFFNQLDLYNRYTSDIVIIDYAYITEDFENRYYDIKHHVGTQAKEVIINCPIDLSVAYLFKWSNLYGVFYTDDSISILTQGIKEISNGEMWLSRKLAQTYILHIRNNIPALSSTLLGSVINKREHEIIRFLIQGKSIVDIAKNYDTSESAIEEYLHNLYRKIGVRNTLQAVVWAKSTLSINVDLSSVNEI